VVLERLLAVPPEHRGRREDALPIALALVQVDNDPHRDSSQRPVTVSTMLAPATARRARGKPWSNRWEFLGVLTSARAVSVSVIGPSDVGQETMSVFFNDTATTEK